MSYDIIETMVSMQAKEIRPASIVQLEGDVQYTRYMAWEMEREVRPKVQALTSCVLDFRNSVRKIQDEFVHCGYVLNVIKTGNLYRYCIQEGEQGYTNFYRFCEDVMRVPKSTAQRLIAINERFCKSEDKMSETYYRFGASKLGIMATFKNGIEGKLTPNVTVKELNKLFKYYASHEWTVDRSTTWKEDLASFQKEEDARRQSKRTYLLGRKFEAATECEQPKKKGFVSDGYKAYTRFFDQTLRSLEQVEGSGNEACEKMLQELKEILHRMQSDVLREQGHQILGF